MTGRRRVELGLAAIQGGVGLNAVAGMAYALGEAEGVPPEWLEGSPFTSYTIPGLYLGFVVGGTCLAGAWMAWRKHRRAADASLLAAAVMVSWIAAQVSVIGYVSPLQPLIAACGLLTAALARRLRQQAELGIAGVEA